MVGVVIGRNDNQAAGWLGRFHGIIKCRQIEISGRNIGNDEVDLLLLKLDHGGGTIGGAENLIGATLCQTGGQQFAEFSMRA